jgi:hypothetical protein
VGLRIRAAAVATLLLAGLAAVPGVAAAQTTVPATVTVSDQAAGATGVTDAFAVTFNSSNGCQWVVNGATFDAPSTQSFAGVTAVEWISGTCTVYGTYTPTSVSASQVTFSSNNGGACEGNNYANTFELIGVANTTSPGSGTATVTTYDGSTAETVSSVTVSTYNGLTVSPTPPAGAFGPAVLTAQLTANGSAIAIPGVSVTWSAASSATPAASLAFNGPTTTNSSGQSTVSLTDSVAPDVATVTASVPGASSPITASASVSWSAPVATWGGGGAGPSVTVGPVGSATVTLPSVTFSNTSAWSAADLGASVFAACQTLLGQTFCLPWTATFVPPPSSCLNAAALTGTTQTTVDTMAAWIYLAEANSSAPLVTSGSCALGFTASVSVDWNVAAGTYTLALTPSGQFTP